MLAYLVIHNNFFTAVYLEPIANIKCRIFRFHLEQCFIRKIQKQL